MAKQDGPKHIYGLHEFGGEHHIIEAGCSGWVVDTVELKNGVWAKDYSGYTEKGLAILARLNWGYEPDGTIPERSLYNEFAKRCADFAEQSAGCSRWIIGNEMNAAWERPGGRAPSTGSGTNVITPELYADCFTRCREELKAAQPEAEVIVGAVAPWNIESGDWLDYFRRILYLLGPDGHDGISLHTYTHGADAALIYSDAKMGAPYQDRHFHFRAYQDFMHAIPAEQRGVSVYITETDQDVPWENANSGWVRAAYGEIDWWNSQPGHQPIRALCLYRWPNIDRWVIEGKAGIEEDLRQALQHQYAAPAPMEVQRRQAEILARLKGVQPKEQVGPAVLDRHATPRARVLLPLNLRRSPGYRGKEASDVVQVLAMGSEIGLTLGPLHVHELTWWQVSTSSTGSPTGSTTEDAGDGLVGYVAERSPTGVQLLEGLRSAQRDLLVELAAEHGIDEGTLRAVVAVESGGAGFRNGRLLVRFEAHVFLQRCGLGQAGDYFAVGEPMWTQQMYRTRPDEEFRPYHGDQDHEWYALEVASRLNCQAAYESASYGAPQIMGFHWKSLGYASARDLVSDFETGEEAQVRAMVRFMELSGCADALRQGDLLAFAKKYNGVGQAVHYAQLLQGRIRQ